jgi:formate C-acetyltransferase
MAVAEVQKFSDRVRREKEELFSAPPQIDTERIKILLEVYKETEGQPTAIRRAKLFHRMCCEKTIYIDGNPIVGTLTQYKYGGYPVPEFGCRWMKKADRFSLQRGLAPITEEAREWIDKAVEYWKDSNIYNRTRDVVLESRGVDLNVLAKCGVGTEFTVGGFMATFADYPKILNKGLKGIAADIESQKAKVDIGGPEGISMWYFYEAGLLAIDGLTKLAHRYASLAREMASKEADPERKAELERIAETCEWVPANPPRNFVEAMQTVWFTILGVWIESPMILSCPPCRFPLYMYPFFKRDKDQGKLTDEDTIELLHFFFLKLNGLAAVLPPHGFAWSQSRIGMQTTLGGLTPDGEDATNELDFLILEAQNRIRLPEPLVNVVYHDKLSEEFLLKCVDLIGTGIGQPAFHNARVGIETQLLYHQMPLELARTMGIVGCVQAAVPGYEDGYWECRFNTAKLIELALNDGKDPLTGTQLGLQTGNAEDFQTYDELYQAVVKQAQHFIPLMRDVSRVGWNVQRDFPLPFGSLLVNDCVEVGKGLVDGGARYSFGDGVVFVGVIDLANSLAAIKSLVFEEKKITMKQLKEALAADFEGHEEIQRMCLGAPKYGNDEEYADSIARGLYELCCQEHQRYPDYLGRPVRPSAYSVTAHFALGRFTGALSSGRKAGKPLCDATVSAQPGTDRNGPAALAKSAAKVLDPVKFGHNHLNMKFHPSALARLEGTRKLLALVKTYFDLGGYHVQFNCVSSDTMKDAQLHPDNYRDLVVRVAGFSAYFVTLDKEVQDEIIARTELQFRA